MKVLLAEDDEAIREGMAEILAERAPVVAVGSVKEALDALAKESFRLVIADMRLGGDREGGRCVLEKAREMGAHVVVMTGLGEREVRRVLDGVPLDGVLSKPFALDDALALFERLLR